MVEMVAKPVVEKMDREIEKKAREVQLRIADILVGSDESSQAYMDAKVRLCHKLGIFIIPVIVKEDQQVVESEIQRLNEDPQIDGIILERPLPKHMDARRLEEMLLPEKDIDCCTPINMGRLFIGAPLVAPATAQAVLQMLEFYEVDVEGKDVVIVGRSNVVGKPLAMMLMGKNATVQILHTKTKDLEKKMKKADILVLSVGKAKMLKKHMVKEGAIVIDVGINVDKQGKLCGDVDEEVREVASMMTPVPGGIGPLTNRVLFNNALILKEKSL